jgi:hypothetical protein
MAELFWADSAATAYIRFQETFFFNSINFTTDIIL